MVLIRALKEIDEEKSEVISIHLCPMDQNDGLNVTEEELSKEGIIVEDYAEPEIREGYYPVMYYNPLTKKIFYEYVENPLSEKEVVADQQSGEITTEPTKEEIIAEATKPLEEKLTQTEKENEALRMLLKMKGIEI